MGPRSFAGPKKTRSLLPKGNEKGRISKSGGTKKKVKKETEKGVKAKNPYIQIPVRGGKQRKG